MKRDVQLFINDQRVDLFDFEDINIVDSIQDIRDISKVFVPFSREFTVPASKNNNKIFRHYYNSDIVNGFDARFKISAVIKINGQLYKRGRVTLLGSTLNRNNAKNYKLVFYASTIDLKTLIGDDMLTDLSGNYITSFNSANSTHSGGFYDSDFVKKGFTNGWTLVSGQLDDSTESGNDNTPKDLIFPFISSNNYYYYDSDNGGSPIEGDTESRNLNTGDIAPKGVYYKDLRGGLRLNIILEAINQKYGINLIGGFFSPLNQEFNRLYLWLQDKKGLYESNNVAVFDFSDATGPQATPTLISTGYSGFITSYYTMRVVVNPNVADDEFRMRIVNKDDSSVLLDAAGKGYTEFTINLSKELNGSNKTFDIQTTLSESDSTSFTIWHYVSEFNWNASTSVYDETDLQFFTEIKSANDVYYAVEHLPKMKIIDFLTSLFNMFNLTAYTDEFDNIVVESLDNYYSVGNTVDITRFVDTEEITVNRNKLYSEISFKYEEPSTLAVIESNELTKDEFGNESINNTNDDPTLSNILAFDGGKYEINPKFEKIQYERMSNQGGAANDTNIGWGWAVDKDQTPNLLKPLVFYAHYEDFSTESPNSLAWDDADGTYSAFSSYYRASNSLSTTSSRLQSINFGSEYDEFNYALGANQYSLFYSYWRNYILSIYDKQSRIVSITANLPSSLVNSIRLNDLIVVDRKKYRINKLNTNITTGKTTLELVTGRDIEPLYNLRVDSDLITVDSTLITVDSR